MSWTAWTISDSEKENCKCVGVSQSGKCQSNKRPVTLM
jgi:hypothetical protein